MVTLRRHAIAVRLRSPAWRRPRPGTPSWSHNVPRRPQLPSHTGWRKPRIRLDPTHQHGTVEFRRSGQQRFPEPLVGQWAMTRKQTCSAATVRA